MKIKKKEIKRIFLEVAICSDCGAELQYTGNFLASNPPQIEMTCPKCGGIEYIEDGQQQIMRFEFAEEAEEVESNV